MTIRWPWQRRSAEPARTPPERPDVRPSRTSRERLSLPPVQRVVEPIESTTQFDGFTRTLTTSRSPALVEPLPTVGAGVPWLSLTAAPTSTPVSRHDGPPPHTVAQRHHRPPGSLQRARVGAVPSTPTDTAPPPAPVRHLDSSPVSNEVPGAHTEIDEMVTASPPDDERALPTVSTFPVDELPVGRILPLSAHAGHQDSDPAEVVQDRPVDPPSVLQPEVAQRVSIEPRPQPQLEPQPQRTRARPPHHESPHVERQSIDRLPPPREQPLRRPVQRSAAEVSAPCLERSSSPPTPGPEPAPAPDSTEHPATPEPHRRPIRLDIRADDTAVETVQPTLDLPSVQTPPPEEPRPASTPIPEPLRAPRSAPTSLPFEERVVQRVIPSPEAVTSHETVIPHDLVSAPRVVPERASPSSSSVPAPPIVQRDVVPVPDPGDSPDPEPSPTVTGPVLEASEPAPIVPVVARHTAAPDPVEHRSRGEEAPLQVAPSVQRVDDAPTNGASSRSRTPDPVPNRAPDVDPSPTRTVPTVSRNSETPIDATSPTSSPVQPILTDEIESIEASENPADTSSIADDMTPVPDDVASRPVVPTHPLPPTPTPTPETVRSSSTDRREPLVPPHRIPLQRNLTSETVTAPAAPQPHPTTSVQFVPDPPHTAVQDEPVPLMRVAAVPADPPGTPGAPPPPHRNAGHDVDPSPSAPMVTLRGAPNPPITVQRHTGTSQPAGIGSPITAPAPGPLSGGIDRPVSLREMFAHVAREVDDDDAEPTRQAPVAQRLEEPSPPSEPASTTEPHPPTTATPIAGTASPAGPLAGMNIDDLANRLYEPIVTRIKTELWLDRERAGLLADPQI